MNFDNIVLLVLRLKIIKMIRITNLIILSILFFVFQVSGINFPDFWFEHITIADGLSQNYITDIKQDKDRLIWIGTKNGLNKYDGYEMTIYNHIQNDSTSIPNNYISYISEQIQAYANTFRKKTVSNNSTSKPRIAHIPTTTSPLFLRTEIILYGSEQKKGV